MMLEKFNLFVQIYMTTKHATQKDVAAVMGINSVTLSRVLTGAQKMRDERMSELLKKLAADLDAEKVISQLNETECLIRQVQHEHFAQIAATVIETVYPDCRITNEENCEGNSVLTVFNQADGIRKLYLLVDTMYADFAHSILGEGGNFVGLGIFDFYKLNTTLANDDAVVVLFSHKNDYDKAIRYAHWRMIELQEYYKPHCVVAYIDLEAGTLEETELK